MAYLASGCHRRVSLEESVNRKIVPARVYTQPPLPEAAQRVPSANHPGYELQIQDPQRPDVVGAALGAGLVRVALRGAVRRRRGEMRIRGQRRCMMGTELPDTEVGKLQDTPIGALFTEYGARAVSREP